MMQIPDCPKSHSNVVLREEFEGRYLLFHLETGAMTGLNHVGAFIWRQLDGQTPTIDISAKMASFFQVSQATAQADIAAFTAALAKENLLAENPPEAL